MTRYRMDAIIKANEVLYHERLTFRKQKEEKLAEAIQA
ncbi:hypothetical protein X559_3065 [Paenilisteria newyorkensis]|nr:hypothetical protein X559_3065 [Listeria newyorkensis]